MNQQPTIHVSYYKATPNGLLAHIYEHAFATRVHNYMRDRKWLLLVDYDMWAHTYERTAVLEFKLHIVSHDELEMALEKLSEFPISLEEIQAAGIECAIENQRKVKEFNPKTLLPQVQQLHKKPWQSSEAFTYDICPEKLCIDEMTSIEGFAYSARHSKDFTHYVIEYEVPAKIFQQSPQLRPLGVLVVQALALNFISSSARDFTYYDSGDLWAHGSTAVVYRHVMTFETGSAPTKKAMEEYTLKYLGGTKNILGKKIHDLIKNHYTNESALYFSQSVISSITRQTIGISGWQKIGTVENTSNIMGSLSIHVLVEK